MATPKAKPAAKKATTSAKAAPTTKKTPAAKPAASKVKAAAPAKKTVAKKTVATTAAPKKAAPVVKKTSAAKPAAKITVTPEERYNMVATAAYYIAERNGFQGCSTEHWIQAEAEISAKLGQ